MFQRFDRENFTFYLIHNLIQKVQKYFLFASFYSEYILLLFMSLLIVQLIYEYSLIF